MPNFEVDGAKVHEAVLRLSPQLTMPELINANPRVVAASDIPSRASRASSDPFQQLLVANTAPDDWDAFAADDDDQAERFDAQEIYGHYTTMFHADGRFVELDI